jgi:alkaline phosphatase
MNVIRNIFTVSRSLVITAILSAGIFHTNPSIGKPKKPKNVIVIIGDGTGLAQWSALSAHYQYQSFASQAGKDRNAMREKIDRDNVCVFQKFPVCGLSQTYSANNYITDSGAGGTAIAVGTKTNNYAIGVDENGKSQPSLAVYAKESGKATGIVVTCELTHATPAAFYAHQPKRSLMSDIAGDLLTTNTIDVAIGGGYPYLKPFNYSNHTLIVPPSTAGKGYPRKLDSIETGLSAGTRMQRTLLMYNQDTFPPKAHQGRAGYLERASVAAMRELNKNANGYFLMIEGSQVDWAGHENDSAYLMAELVDLDNTIREVVNEVEKNQKGETLIIVTADHETGGLSLVGWDKKNGCAKLAWSTHDHTGIPVPVFAYGPGSELFTGAYQNNDIFFKLLPFLSGKK